MNVILEWKKPNLSEFGIDTAESAKLSKEARDVLLKMALKRKVESFIILADIRDYEFAIALEFDDGEKEKIEGTTSKYSA